MSKPHIAAASPIAVELKQGREYWWCACGRSSDQPFCDGSHQGTGFEPLPFTAEASGQAWLCRCKHTGTPPWCDGSHNRLGAPAHEAPPEVVEEPALGRVHALARGEDDGLAAMGVPWPELPQWRDLQLLPAQGARLPLPQDTPVATRLVVGPGARKPLTLDIPLLISDMSFGALSREAKIALARGAERAGTGICSGEGGMLPEERQACSRYFFELGPALYGYREERLEQVQAFHFKLGQGAKSGVGGHLPGSKVTEEIARVRGIEAGRDAISPPTFDKLRSPADFRRFADRVREISGGIPVGMKFAASHIEDDIDFALEAGMDYLILDGRGGGTGAAPRVLRDNIGVPTIPALARARRHLRRRGREEITLIVTGGLRVPEDFTKALALGADGVALATSALQAIGCVASRICHTNRCPTGIATQDPELRKRLDVDLAARRLERFLHASLSQMKLLARACGREALGALTPGDLATWKREMAALSGVRFAGDPVEWTD